MAQNRQALKGMNKKDRDLLQDITVMMTDPQQAQNEKKINDIMTKIRQLNAQKSPDQLRLAACHFMTMYHTRKAMSIGMPQENNQGMDAMMQHQQALTSGNNDNNNNNNSINLKQVEKFKKEQRKDMLLGWSLLNINGEDEQANKTARVLKIEVAQRLEDSLLLNEAFQELISGKLSQEEIMVAFTAAPFLGDWKEMMKLGKHIEKMQGGMEQLHMMSLQLPIPDFTLIYDLAKEYKLDQLMNDTPDIQSLTWDLFNVSKIRVKFNDVNCGEYEDKRQELIEEITKQGDVEWEDVPNVSHVHIKRMGALCQAVSFGEIPMMLNGPWFEDKIHVKGRAEMPLMPENEQDMGGMGGMGGYGQMPNPENMTILIQEEEWKLMKDSENSLLYRGVYYLKQRPELPPNKQATSEHAPVNMTFDIEILLNNTNTNNKNKNIDDDEEIVEDEKMENEDFDDNDDNVVDVTIPAQNDEETTKVTTEFDGLELD